MEKRKQARDIVVTGSTSVVRTLTAQDLVDEYRLVMFPLVLGEGTRLFPGGTPQVHLSLVSAEPLGPAVRLIYTRARQPTPASDNHPPSSGYSRRNQRTTPPPEGRVP